MIAIAVMRLKRLYSCVAILVCGGDLHMWVGKEMSKLCKWGHGRSQRYVESVDPNDGPVSALSSGECCWRSAKC